MTGPIPFIGGKNRLARQIIALFPEHRTYVEPFAGGAQVFFRKKPSKVEVLNDLDGDVVNFFRVCQWHYEELIRQLKYAPASRRLHEIMLGSDPDGLTDIQRAARFLYLQKNSFGALVRGRSFHYGVVQPSNYNPGRIPGAIEKAHRRLRRVQIENLPYEEILKRYDRPTTLFYLDPPYFGRRLYRWNFSDKDFAALETQLCSLKGRFVLSINDVPEMRSLFQRFTIKKVGAAYSAQTRAGNRYGELLIRNFEERTG